MDSYIQSVIIVQYYGNTYNNNIINNTGNCTYNITYLSLDELERRPKLKLLPRTIKDPPNQEERDRNTQIFGAGKPRDEKNFEVKRKESSSNASESPEPHTNESIAQEDCSSV